MELPASKYHANTGQYLTSSLLRDFIRSPRLYRDQIETGVRNETDAMRLGTATHCFFLEPDRWQSEYVIKPADIKFTTKEGKAWRDKNAGRSIIGADDVTILNRMLGRMPEDVRRLLLIGNKYEVTVRNKLGDLDAQCRLDCWNREGNVIVDLKTISAIERIEKAIWQNRYDIQLRFYSQLVQVETGVRPVARLVFIETAAPFRWKIVELDVDFNMMADMQICAALERLHACTRSGDWSDRSDQYMMASPPVWMREDEEDED